MDEIRRRLTAVENEQAAIREQARQAQRTAELYAVVDHDVADLRLAFSQQRQVLNAIGHTQSEQAATLRRQGDVLGGLVLEVTTIRHTQTEHERLLNAHTEMLTEHTQMLKEHTQMLTEQGQMLRQVLDRLPASEN
jgi:hypothetical protein